MNRIARRTLVLTICLLVQACTSHVQLSAPDPDAPYKERLAAAERLRAVSISETHVYDSTHTTQYVNYLQLRDGRRVADPADFVPVVETDSPTAAAIRRFDTYVRRQRIMRIVAASLMVTGGALVTTAFIRDKSWNTPMMWTGVGIVAAGIGTHVAGRIPGGKATNEKRTAFSLYNDDLLIRLRIRPDGTDANAPVQDNAPAPIQTNTMPAPLLQPVHQLGGFCSTGGIATCLQPRGGLAALTRP